ncbi:MAG TPA: hypothetical protein VND93_08860 [Myxococcales bacterium]|nr:hypothetical protein [Myxococcales bacterium]
MTRMLVGMAVLAALGSGCAMAPAKPQKNIKVKVMELSDLPGTNLAPDKTYICEEQVKTGSNYRSAVCQTVRDRDIEHQASQDQLRRMMQAGSTNR